MNCPYRSEANWMCGVLVGELTKSCTWKDKKDICEAILAIRFEEKNMIDEWNLLNNGKTNTLRVPPELQ